MGGCRPATDLEGFLAAHAARPWAWGINDCSLILADWAIANGHPDAAAHLRGTYASKDECRAVVEAAGGLVALVGDCVARIDLRPIDRPEVGAIGVIGSRSDMHRQFGSIFDGIDWQWRTASGFVGMKAAPLAIWAMSPGPAWSRVPLGSEPDAGNSNPDGSLVRQGKS